MQGPKAEEKAPKAPEWPKTRRVPKSGAWNKTLVLTDGSVVHPFVVL